MAKRASRYAALAAGLVGSVALACFFTVGTDLGALTNRLFDDGDSITVLWTMDSVGHNFHSGVPVADLPMFYPNKGVLFFSGHLLVPSVFYNGFKLLVGSPVFAFNLTLICFLVLNFWSMFVFCRHFAGRFASALGATLFAFAAFRLSQLGHPQIMAQFFLPLMGHFLFLYERKERLSYFLMAVVCLVAQFYVGIYQGLVAALTVLPYLVLKFFFVSDRKTWALRLGAAALVWLTLLLPLAIPYYNVMTGRRVERLISEAHIYGAHFTHFFAAPETALWHSVTEPFLRARHHMFGKRLFLGLAAFILVGLGLRWIARHGGERRKFILWLSASALIFLIWMSHGPQAQLYTLFHSYVPGFKAMRVPSRIGFGYLFVMAALAALGAHALCQTRKPYGFIAAAVLGCLLLVENKIRPEKRVAPDQLLEVSAVLREGTGPIAHLPLDSAIYPRFYANLFHRRPLFNGESAFVPEPQASLSLEEKNNGPTQALFHRLRGFGIRDFVVSQGHPWQAIVLSACSPRTLFESAAHAVYQCPAAPLEASPLHSARPQVPPAGE